MSASKAILPQQRTVYFDGRVQGVGFRYTTQRIAGGYRVSGYVQNLDDGRVLLVVEGDAAELDRFVEEICSALAYYIGGVQSSNAAATGEFSGFRIRH